MDDAFVYFRYVDNALFLKIGLVYNQGEYVEGYSSPGWMLVLLLLRAIEIDWWYLIVGLGVLTYVCFWAALVHLHRRWRFSSIGINAPLIYLTANYGVLTYFTSGLETPLVQLVAVLYAHAIFRPSSRGLQWCLAASPLIRQELVLPLFMLFAWSWIRERRFPAGLALKSAIVLGAWMVFRVWYYADLFPSTYYLKDLVMAGQGWTYLTQTLSTYHFFIATALFVIAFFFVRRIDPTDLYWRERLAMVLCASAVTAYVVKIGGDERHYRYLAFPFCLFVCAWGGLLERLPVPRKAVAPASLVFYFLVASLYPPQLDRHPVTYREEHKMVDKIIDASWHRKQNTLQPEMWRRGVTIDGLRAFADGNTPFKYDEIETTGWCVRAYVKFNHRIVNTYGLTDAFLARTDTPSGRPGHKLGLIPMAHHLAEAQTALGWSGRGMYRAIQETGMAPPWIGGNLETLELIESKVYNQKDLWENLALAFTRVPKVDPGDPKGPYLER